MPMSEEFRKLLEDSLKDVKYGEDKALDLIVDSFGLNEKSKKDLEEVIAERNDYKEKKKVISKKLEEYNAELEKIKEQNEQLSKRQRTSKDDDIAKKGMTEEVEARINTLEETLRKVNESLELTQKEKEEALKLSQAEKYNSAQTSLDKEFITALGKYNIIGEKCDDALDIVKRRGLAKIETTEDGYVRKFIYKDESGVPFDLKTVNGVAAHIAKLKPYLVSSSGITGPDSGGNNDDFKFGDGKTDFAAVARNSEQNI